MLIVLSRIFWLSGYKTLSLIFRSNQWLLPKSSQPKTGIEKQAISRSPILHDQLGLQCDRAAKSHIFLIHIQHKPIL
jgi:hypothetical protein